MKVHQQFVVLITWLLIACPSDTPNQRAPLTLEKVPARLAVTTPVSGLPDANAEYGIVTDMDGDGVDEWVLVYFAGTTEIIDRYAIVLFERKGDEWVRTDYLDSSDPALPKFFTETTPDLPPRPDIVPEWLSQLPTRRGQGWTGEALDLWNSKPQVALPILNLDGQPGNEVIVPLTGLQEWRLLVLAKRQGRLVILDQVDGLTLQGVVN